MKTLSVRQPWANLIVHGIKDVENRSRRTNYRGRVLIHAPVKDDLLYSITQKIIDYLCSNNLLQKYKDAYETYWMNSAIIGSVEITGCINDSKSVWAQEDCWHWILKDPILFDKPITDVKGMLGLWNYDLPGGYNATN